MASDKKIIALSHTDRLKNDKYRHKFKLDTKMPCHMPVEIQEVVDNRVVTHTEYREVDTHANDKFKVTDFALENLIAVGATDLNPTSLIRDSLSASDNLISQLSD